MQWKERLVKHYTSLLLFLRWKYISECWSMLLLLFVGILKLLIVGDRCHWWLFSNILLNGCQKFREYSLSLLPLPSTPSPSPRPSVLPSFFPPPLSPSYSLSPYRRTQRTGLLLVFVPLLSLSLPETPFLRSMQIALVWKQSSRLGQATLARPPSLSWFAYG